MSFLDRFALNGIVLAIVHDSATISSTSSHDGASTVRPGQSTCADGAVESSSCVSLSCGWTFLVTEHLDRFTVGILPGPLLAEADRFGINDLDVILAILVE